MLAGSPKLSTQEDGSGQLALRYEKPGRAEQELNGSSCCTWEVRSREELLQQPAIALDGAQRQIEPPECDLPQKGC